MADTGLFPRSKFRAPPGAEGVTEHQLARRIEDALERVPLAIVMAPAGFGKTTALSAWSTATRRWQPLWIRLDPQDDDPHTLTHAVATAVSVTMGAAPRRAEGLLAAASAGDAGQLAAALSNDLDDLDDVVMVLDDVHHLRSADSLDLLSRLLDMLGPSSRVLAASRTEPKVGMLQRRVRRQVAEFGADDLRLDRAQVEIVLRSCGVDDPELAGLIQARSGGWAAAAVLMSAGAATGGRSRIEAGERLGGEVDVDELVRVEVLDHLAPDLQRFALETSLLDELECAACESVTARDDAGRVLEEIGRHGLLESVEGGASRYHDRVAEVLRRELTTRTSPEELLELHHRAAAVSEPSHAIQLLVEVGDLEAAGRLVVDAGRAMLTKPGGRLPRRWLAPFTGPAADLGTDGGLSANAAWLATFVGLAAIEDGDIAGAIPSLDAAVASMRALGDHAGMLRAGYGRAEAHLARGELDPAASLIDELMTLPAPPDERVRLLMGRLWLEYFSADWPTIESTLDEAISLALGRCNEIGRGAVALGLGSEFLFAPRGPQWFSDRCAELGHRVGGDLMAVTSLELMRAAAHLLAGRIEEADAFITAIDERALELGGLNWLGLIADRVRLGLALATGDHEAIDGLVGEARQLFDESDRHRQERAMYAYGLARSGWMLEQPDRVREGRLLIGEVSAHDRPDTVITDAVIRAMVHRNQRELTLAETALTEARELQHSLRFCLVTGVIDLELSATLLAQDRADDAVETAAPALVLLDELGAYGVLAMDGGDTHGRVLDACSGDPAVGAIAREMSARLQRPDAPAGFVVARTGERLTSRELEVLRLVMAGRSNREIGGELYISERTVKSHMTSIMRKLDVSSRTAAIARAHELAID